MKYILIILSCLLVIGLSAQDCQLISLTLPVPEGVTKHHFPPQEMPVSSDDQAFFTYLSSWDQGELVIKMRFSADGTTWTKWNVLKKDYTQPEATQSPLHLASAEHRYFEWAVYNKAGLESELALNFYYPTERPAVALTPAVYEMEATMVACPQPDLMEVNDGTTIVGNGKDD